MINLRNKTFAVFGMRATGKTTLVHHIASEFGAKAFIYDTMNEAPPSVKYHTYSPKEKYGIAELEHIIRQVVKANTYSLFILDEANRFCPTKPHTLPPVVADLNDECRKYGLSCGWIARRPVQLHQDLTELADYIFIFQLKGISDIKNLNNFSAGLGDEVLALKDFHFVLVQPNRSFKTYQPIVADKVFLDYATSLQSRAKKA